MHAIEIDRAAASVYQRNWGMDPFGDVTLVANDDAVTVPKHDVLCAGFPCQPFSKSGAQQGMEETRGTLYWNILRIIEECQPAVVLLENVRNLAGPRHRHEWQVIVETLRAEGYRVSDTPWVVSPHLLPRDRGGRPQVRERVFVTATRTPAELGISLDAEPLDTLRTFGDWDPHCWHLEDDLPLDPNNIVQGCELSDAERLWIDAWDEFVRIMWEEREGRRLPGFPLWADDWRDLDLGRLEHEPRWKVDFLTKNAAFYEAHKNVIDKWASRWGIYTSAFPVSRRKA